MIPSNIINTSQSTSTNSSSTTTIIQTNKQITIQDIDTTKYEEIPAKEPDLTRQPEKSALKKANAVKRRVIPVLRENQRPSPRPSPKINPVVILSSPPISTINNDEHNSDYEHNENDHPSSNDDDDDDDDDGNNNEPKKRFANVKRNDSLARFLKDRPLPTELFDKHILVKPVDERKNEREVIETKLERKLSLRPSPEELEQRNILRAKTQAELIAEKEEKKRYLIRKLSFRPSIQGKKNNNKITILCIYSFLFFRTS
jgi:phosphatase and actin regulator 4